MRVHRTISLAVLALLALPPLLAGQTFEGTLKQRTLEVDDQSLYDLVYGDGLDESEEGDAWLRATAARVFAMPVDEIADRAMASPEVVTIYVRGDRVRYDTQDGSYVIVDVGSGVTTMVNPQERFFMKISADDVEAAASESQRMADEMMKKMGIDPDEVAAEAEADPRTESEGPAPRVRALGKTATVNGIEASAREASMEEQIAVGWCAADTWGLRNTMKKMAEQAGALEDDMEDPGSDSWVDLQDIVCGDDLPVKVQVFRANDMSAYTLDEILSIDPTPVDADKFVVPTGYTERKLSDFWR